MTRTSPKLPRPRITPRFVAPLLRLTFFTVPERTDRRGRSADDGERLPFALIDHVFEVAATGEFDGHFVARLVDVAELGPLSKRRHIIRAGQAIGCAIEQVAGEVTDRGRSAANDVDLIEPVRR